MDAALYPNATGEDSGPVESPLAAFWSTPPNLDTEVETLLRHPGLLTATQLIDLQALLAHYGVDRVPYGADFDFKVEIEAQLAAVRAMRNRVMTQDGRLQEGIATREAKEVIAASTTLLTTLMKHHEKILSFERQRALEEAVKAAVQCLPETARSAFFGELERRLGDES